MPGVDDLAAVLAGARARCRPPSRRAGWCPRRARRRSACCRGRAAGSGSRSAGGCRAGAGRCSARRARRARRPGRTRSGWPAGSAAPRRRTACRTAGRARGSPGRRRAGSPSRAWISLSTRSAICFSRAVSSSVAQEARRSRAIGRRQTCGDRLAAEQHGQRLRLEPGAAADRAGHLAHVALVALPAPVRVGLGVPALHERDGALEAGRVRALPAVPVPVPDVHLVVLAVQQGLLGPLRQRPPRHVHREAEVVAERRHQPLEVLGATPASTARSRPRPGSGPRRGPAARGRPRAGCRCRCTRGRRRTGC